jgi:hypothetical protein
VATLEFTTAPIRSFEGEVPVDEEQLGAVAFLAPYLTR